MVHKCGSEFLWSLDSSFVVGMTMNAFQSSKDQIVRLDNSLNSDCLGPYEYVGVCFKCNFEVYYSF